jgi:hypothetical protein
MPAASPNVSDQHMRADEARRGIAGASQQLAFGVEWFRHAGGLLVETAVIS